MMKFLAILFLVALAFAQNTPAEEPIDSSVEEPVDSSAENTEPTIPTDTETDSGEEPVPTDTVDPDTKDGPAQGDDEASSIAMIPSMALIAAMLVGVMMA